MGTEEHQLFCLAVSCTAYPAQHCKGHQALRQNNCRCALVLGQHLLTACTWHTQVQCYVPDVHCARRGKEATSSASFSSKHHGLPSPSSSNTGTTTICSGPCRVHLQALILATVAAHRGLVLLLSLVSCLLLAHCYTASNSLSDACCWHTTQWKGRLLHVPSVCCCSRWPLGTSAFPPWCLLLAQLQKLEVTLAAHRGFWCLALALLMPAAGLLAPLLAPASSPSLWSVPVAAPAV